MYRGEPVAKYAVLYEGERKDSLAPDLLKGHVDHLRNLHSKGILLSCGPLKNDDVWVGKGLLTFEANTKEDVEKCVLQDPFIIHKWYAEYHIYEWVEANDSNNYLS